MSLHVIAPSLASPARSGLPLRGSPPGRESGAHAALSCSPARRRRKLIGFLRRERRFDVVSHIVLAPYFSVLPIFVFPDTDHCGEDVNLNDSRRGHAFKTDIVVK